MHVTWYLRFLTFLTPCFCIWNIIKVIVQWGRKKVTLFCYIFSHFWAVKYTMHMCACEVASVMHLDHASEPASHYVSCIAGGFFSTSAAWEAQHAYNWHKKTYIYWLKRRMSPIVYIPSVSPLPWHPCSMYSLLWEAGPDPNSLHPQLPLPSDFCWHRPMGQCTDLFSTHCPYLCK